MSLTQNAMGPSRSVTAFFDTKGAADRAVADVEAVGVPRQDITMVEGGAGATGMASTAGHEGFLASLKDMFMPEEDRFSYAEGLRRGGYLVSVKTGQVDTDRVLDILDRDGAVDMDERESTWRSEGWTGYGTSAVGVTSSTAAAGLSSPSVGGTVRDAAPYDTVRTADVTGGGEVIPVYEERLQIGKREVSHGRLRVRSYVVETPVEEQVTLHSENVRVERRPVDRAVAVAVDDALFRERTVELEEYAEEAVVTKEARVVEEVSLRKEAQDRTETVRDTVRRTEVEVDDQRTAAGVGRTRGVREGSDDGRIVEKMEVYASDGTKVGAVDRMDGVDGFKLAASTSPDGQHHHVPMSWVDHVDQHVHLNRTVSEMKAGR